MIKNSIDEIKEVLGLLPLLISYIAPGYVFFSLKKYMFVEKYKRDNYFILSCLVVSYIVVHIEESICEIAHIEYNINTPKFGIIAILIAIIGAYIFHLIANNAMFNKIFSLLGMNQSMSSNIFENIIDKHGGAWLRLYINEENIIYTGELVYVNEHEGENKYYIVLKNYKRSSYDSEETIDNEYQGDKNWAMIDASKVSRIEIIHGDNSNKVKKEKKEKKRRLEKIIMSIFHKKYIKIKKSKKGSE